MSVMFLSPWFRVPEVIILPSWPPDPRSLWHHAQLPLFPVKLLDSSTLNTSLESWDKTQLDLERCATQPAIMRNSSTILPYWRILTGLPQMPLYQTRHPTISTVTPLPTGKATASLWMMNPFSLNAPNSCSSLCVTLISLSS